MARTEAARRAESTSGHCPEGNPALGPGEPGGQSPLPPPLLLHPQDMADDHSAHRTRSNEDAAPASAASEITPVAEAAPAGGAAAGGVAGGAAAGVTGLAAAGAEASPPPGTPRSSVAQLMQQASASEFEVAFNLTGESLVWRGQRVMVSRAIGSEFVCGGGGGGKWEGHSGKGCL